MENRRPKKWLDSIEKQKKKNRFELFCEKISPNLPNFRSHGNKGRQHFAWFYWIGHHRKPLNRCKHLRPICHTSRLVGDFVSHFGESILGVRGPKSKIEEQRFVECHMENWRPRNGSIPSRNKKEESIWMCVCNNSPNLPKFRCHGNKGSPHNILYGTVESAIPKNPLVGANMSVPSAVQAEL